MRILSDWFAVAVPNWTIQLAGTVLLLLPVALRRDLWPTVASADCFSAR